MCRPTLQADSWLFFGKPLVTQQLRVKVFDLVRGVMHVRVNAGWGTLGKDRVMIRVLFAEVQIDECHHVDVGLVREVQDVGGYGVEILTVECNFLVEILANVPIVSKLVHHCWARAVSLEATWTIN
jgi:hypothetical protein